ncbi:MAG: undecaprenyl-diphosphate phosphatase, partial [Candidatus Brocadiaceae bacterium]
MGVTEAILLGCLQGLTEFLPISSSAHLVAAQHALGTNEPGIALEVCLHFGTLLAIVLVFGARLVRLTADAFRGAAIWLRGGGTGPAA